jgi:5'-deoxynucleotidase YfbR-like HD superfamily hydrolase
MTADEYVKALRESGMTERLHVIPHHRHYDVAQHSWTMAALLFALHPSPSQNLLWAVLFHDVPERWTGDIPWPAKQGELGDAIEELEHKISKQLGLRFDLTREDVQWLEALDCLELLLYCEDEMDMGNRMVARCWETCAHLLEDRNTPDEIIGFIDGHRPGRSADNTLEES